MQNRTFSIIWWASLAGFVIYLCLRITGIPITHDEAGTILNFSTQPVWDIVTFKDPVPNNHILHTLLVKACTWIFGYGEFACRLPNLVGGIMYWIFGSLVLLKITGQSWGWTLVGLTFLIANPYLIEFFGLARGYGLSIAWMMLSLCLLIRVPGKHLNASLVCAAIAVYINLTLLHFFIPLFILVLALQINRTGGRLGTNLGIPVLVFILLLSCIGLPVARMVKTDQFQFWGTSGFYTDTYMPLLKSSLLGKHYFGDATVQIMAWVVGIVTLLVGYGLIRLLVRTKWSAILLAEFQLGYLFIATIVYNLLQNLVFKIPFLNARTALLFYPLFVLAAFSMFIRINMNRKWKVALILPVLALALWHIRTGYNLHSSYEWWFDGDNKKVMKAIVEDKPDHPAEGKPVLKCNWIFQPSLTYYSKVYYKEVVSPPPYSKTVDTSSLADYYYITSEDKNDWFDRNYTVLKSFAWDSRYLMKKNTVDH